MSCPIQPYGACVELTNLNATTVTPQNFLDLIHQRRRLKTDKNLWHDRLVCRLPVEILSLIFIFLDKVNKPGKHEAQDLSSPQRRHWDHLLRTPALLSRVCRGWRNIVLSTPQLWTNLFLDVWTQSYKLEVLQTILSRSGSLPLSLVLAGGPRVKEHITPLEPLAKVIRTHSTRWETLNLVYAPGEMAHILLHNLDNTPTSDLLDLRFGSVYPNPITLPEPLRPRRFYITVNGNEVSKMPLQWDNCTYLELSNISITTLLRIVPHIPRLTTWVSGDVELADPLEHLQGTGNLFPASPITIPTLESLVIFFKDNDALLFRHLTLPGLTHLRCRFGEGDFVEDPHDLELDDLINFIARSRLDSKTLQTFGLKYYISEGDYDRRFTELTAITHLEIPILPFSDEVNDSLLSPISNTSAFPRLRALQIETPQMSASSWTLLCDIIGRNILPVADETRSQRLPDRPLELVSVFLFGHPCLSKMQHEDYLFLREIQNSGVVKLEVEGFETKYLLPKIPTIDKSLDH